MLIEERKIRILEILHKEEFVSIHQLMNLLNVSRSSVIRDLDELEIQGLIVRKRGGACLVDRDYLLSQFNEAPVEEKENTHSHEKRRICKYAASLIKNGNTIYVDSGTTSLFLMDYILDKDVTIVTPNIYLLNRISEHFKGKIVILNGEYNPAYQSISGPGTRNMLEEFHFDYAFMTTNGINYEKKEVYGFQISVSLNKKIVIQRSEEVVLLVDSSKTMVTGLCTWAHQDDFDYIFTEKIEGLKASNVIVCE